MDCDVLQAALGSRVSEIFVIPMLEDGTAEPGTGYLELHFGDERVLLLRSAMDETTVDITEQRFTETREYSPVMWPGRPGPTGYAIIQMTGLPQTCDSAYERIVGKRFTRFAAIEAEMTVGAGVLLEFEDSQVCFVVGFDCTSVVDPEDAFLADRGLSVGKWTPVG